MYVDRTAENIFIAKFVKHEILSDHKDL